MSKQYYFQNMCWGWFMGGFILYLSWNDNFKYENILLVVVFLGVVLYPLAKWIVESFFLTFTTREFWNRGLFMDTAGKMGLLAIYSGTVFLLSIPIIMIFMITLFIKRLLAAK